MGKGQVPAVLSAAATTKPSPISAEGRKREDPSYMQRTKGAHRLTDSQRQ